jgi:hypothetical protein
MTLLSPHQIDQDALGDLQTTDWSPLSPGQEEALQVLGMLGTAGIAVKTQLGPLGSDMGVHHVAARSLVRLGLAFESVRHVRWRDKPIRTYRLTEAGKQRWLAESPQGEP